MYRKCFLLIFLLPLASLGAIDYGLAIGQSASVDNKLGDESEQIKDGFEYRADIWPSLSFLVGDSGEFFASAGLTIGRGIDGFYFIPELLRTEFSYRSGSWGISAGRIQYSDPLGIVASGLFDGARFSYNSSVGTFGIGAWYTGLLYKKNASITMTGWEQVLYNSPVVYGDFVDTYFAPRHLLASLDWEHPSVGEKVRLSAALTAQIDLSGKEEKYNSQYTTIKAAMPYKSFIFELGGSLEAAEFKPDLGDKNFNIAYAADFGVYYNLPTKFNSRLSLTGCYTSGQTDGLVGAFNPLTNKLYGNILQAGLSGISIFSLDYTARLAQALGLSLNAVYFMRNDLGTYLAYPVNPEDNSGYLLGAELFGRLIWSPFSDLQFNLGGGAFLPSLGNAGPNERINWRVELSAIIALF